MASIAGEARNSGLPRKAGDIPFLQDVAIAISHSGATKSTVRTAGVANAPAPRKADVFLQAPIEPLPGSAEALNRIVAIAPAEVLFECLADGGTDMFATSARIDGAFNEDRCSRRPPAGGGEGRAWDICGYVQRQPSREMRPAFLPIRAIPN